MFFGENEFYEQGKRAGAIGGIGAGPCDRHLRPSFAESFSGERTVRENAVIAGHPGFTQGLGQGRLFREKRSERKRAPRAWAEDRLQPRGAYFHLFWPKK